MTNWKMNITRPVEWSKYHNGKLIPVGQATFHQFGMESRPEGDPHNIQWVNVSVAIIELPDGTVKNVPVEHIKFLDK